MRFWDFSLSFYGDADVQAACLAAQDGHGADVNVVLYLLWRGRSGEAFDGGGIAEIDAAVAPWREAAVRPLRAVRRALKDGDLLGDREAQEALRSKVKKVELEAERRQQEALERLDARPAASGLDPRTAAERSLDAYAGRLRAPLPPGLRDVFLSRLEAVT